MSIAIMINATIIITTTTISKISLTHRQQRFTNRRPLVFERAAINGFSRSDIPVLGIRGVAFLTMQIGVNPVTRGFAIFLGEFVGLVPVAFGIEPKRLESE